MARGRSIALYLLIIHHFVIIQAIPLITSHLISDESPYEPGSTLNLLSTDKSCVPLSGTTTGICLFIHPISLNRQKIDVMAGSRPLMVTEVWDVCSIKFGTVCFSGLTYDSTSNFIEKEHLFPAPDTLSVMTSLLSEGFKLPFSTEHQPLLPTSLKRDATLPVISKRVCEKYLVKTASVGFFPGFILGLIVGASIVYLMSTGRHRKQRRGRSMLGLISKPHLVSQMRSDFLRKYQYKSSICLSDTPEENRGSRYQTSNIFMHPGEEMNEIPRAQASPEPLIPHQPIRFPDRSVPPYSTQRTTTVNELFDSPLDYHQRNSHGLAGLSKGRPHLYKASSYSPLLAPREL